MPCQYRVFKVFDYSKNGAKIFGKNCMNYKKKS